MFDKVKRFYIKNKAYSANKSKYYCQDIGLRNVRLNFREQNQGFLIENVVYNELITRGYRVDVGFINQRRKIDSKYQFAQLEVDFVVRKSSKEYYVQIINDLPNGQHLENEYTALIKVPGSFKKIIVINKSLISYTNELGILIISLEEFLLNLNSLDL